MIPKTFLNTRKERKWISKLIIWPALRHVSSISSILCWQFGSNKYLNIYHLMLCLLSEWPRRKWLVSPSRLWKIPLWTAMRGTSITRLCRLICRYPPVEWYGQWRAAFLGNWHFFSFWQKFWNTQKGVLHVCSNKHFDWWIYWHLFYVVWAIFH